LIYKSKSIFFRLAETDDASFILKLRLDKKLGRFISKTLPDINKQMDWLKKYKLREKLGQEYYFIICKKHNNKPIGTVRLYNIEVDTLEWGSWIINHRDTSVFIAIESIILIYKIIFEKLGYNNCHFEVRKDNKEVVAFHKLYGAEVIKSDKKNFYFIFPKEKYFEMLKKYKMFL
jgi:RimJ/RimL family protein N-acetyltransferase